MGALALMVFNVQTDFRQATGFRLIMLIIMHFGMAGNNMVLNMLDASALKKERRGMPSEAMGVLVGWRNTQAQRVVMSIEVGNWLILIDRVQQLQVKRNIMTNDLQHPMG